MNALAHKTNGILSANQHSEGLRIVPKDEQENKPDWITTKEAAEIMGVATSNVRYLCLRNRIKCQKFGKSWMIWREAAEDYQRSKRDPEWLYSNENENS